MSTFVKLFLYFLLPMLSNIPSPSWAVPPSLSWATHPLYPEQHPEQHYSATIFTQYLYDTACVTSGVTKRSILFSQTWIIEEKMTSLQKLVINSLWLRVRVMFVRFICLCFFNFLLRYTSTICRHSPVVVKWNKVTQSKVARKRLLHRVMLRLKNTLQLCCVSLFKPILRKREKRKLNLLASKFR